MFLVAGCCIGGGMLALPVGSGFGGFIPSLAMMLLCWAGMTLSALLLMEVCLWMKEEAHVITLTSKILGPLGKAVAWVLFLYISYASVVAYAAGGGGQAARMLQAATGWEVSSEAGAALIALFFTAVVAFGGEIVGRVNALLFFGLIGAYFMLVGFGIDEVRPELLAYQKWSKSLLAIPLLLTAFSFQTMVPSLTPILKHHTNALRLSIVGGTTIALVVYAVWQLLILGIIPVEGEKGLIEANRLAVPATEFLYAHVGGKWFLTIAQFFGFFAIVTSFLAMGLGLFDFLSDGLGIKKRGLGKLWLALLIALPTILFAVKYERAFMVAMETSGGFGDTILNGMFPVLMVWIGRYRLGYANSFRVPGGKPLLVVVFLYFLVSLTIEILMQTGYLPMEYEAYDLLEYIEPTG